MDAGYFIAGDPFYVGKWCGIGVEGVVFKKLSCQVFYVWEFFFVYFIICECLELCVFSFSDFY